MESNENKKLKFISNKQIISFFMVVALILTVAPWTMREAYSRNHPILEWVDGKLFDWGIIDEHLTDSLLSPIVDSINDYVNGFTSAIGTSIVDAILCSFDPSYNAITQLLAGDEISAGNEAVAQEAFFGLDPINNLSNGAKIIGFSLASIILMINLLLLMFGKADQIRISLPQLLVNYFISMIAIGYSETLMYQLMTTFGNVWKNVVMSDGGITINFESHLVPILAGAAALVKIPGLAGIMSIFALIIFWKFFKGFLKLYMSIVEHYLIMVILTILFPAIIPTAITPSTNNMFKAYLRMIISQFVCMAMTVLLMAFFVSTLITGGWTHGILNYIAALAFLKVAANVDTYMSKMGFDIVAGAGNFARAGMGVGATLMGIMRGAAMISGQADKLTNKKIEASVKSDDFASYVEGSRSKPGGQNISDEALAKNFNEEVIKANNVSGNRDYASLAEAQNAGVLNSAYANGLNNVKYGSISADGTVSYAKNADGSVMTMADNVASVRQRQFGNSVGLQFMSKNGATVGVGRDGIVYAAQRDTTTYNKEKGAEGIFVGYKGVSDKSDYMSLDEIKSHMPDDVKSFRSVSRGTFEGNIPVGMQKYSMDCGNGTYRDAHIVPVGNSLIDDVPKNWTASEFTSKNNMRMRIMYSPLKSLNEKYPDTTPDLTSNE